MGPVYVDTGTAETTYADTDVDPGVLYVYRAGKAGLEGLRLHDRRHTHASLMLSKGIHLKVVSERLQGGHSGGRVVLRPWERLGNCSDFVRIQSPVIPAKAGIHRGGAGCLTGTEHLPWLLFPLLPVLPAKAGIQVLSGNGPLH